MSIIPIIFFALLFGFGSIFSSTGEATVTQEATPMPPSASSLLPSDGAHALFTTREELPGCDSWQCLQHAVDQGSSAELVRIRTTFEGDRIRTYYRVTPAGRYEIFTDNSQDAYLGNGPAWTYDVCALPDDLRQGCPGS